MAREILLPLIKNNTINFNAYTTSLLKSHIEDKVTAKVVSNKKLNLKTSGAAIDDALKRHDKPESDLRGRFLIIEPEHFIFHQKLKPRCNVTKSYSGEDISASTLYDWVTQNSEPQRKETMTTLEGIKSMIEIGVSFLQIYKINNESANISTSDAVPYKFRSFINEYQFVYDRLEQVTCYHEYYLKLIHTANTGTNETIPSAHN